MKCFTRKELRSIDNFQEEHSNCYKSTKTAKSFTIKQNYGSGIGIGTYITCDCCGTVKDCTDYSMW